MEDILIFKAIGLGAKYALKKMKEYNEETQDDPYWNPTEDPVVGPGMFRD